jgi:hypothetical protein
MNKRQKNKYDMIGSVANFGETENGALAGIPALVNAFSDIKGFYRELGLNENIMIEGTHGKVVSKNVSQEEIINTGLSLAGAIYGYAALKGNDELMNFADIKRGTFGRQRDSEIPLTVEKYLDKADALGAELVPFGITDERRASARERLNDYLEKFSGLSTGKGVKKAARETINILFEKADKKLKILDKLMVGFKTGDPELYSRYTSARMIYDKGIHVPAEEQKAEEATAPA